MPNNPKLSTSMGSSLYLLLIFLCFHSIVIIVSSFSKPPLCHDDERLALSELQQSFTLNEYASLNPAAYPKTSSWKPEESNDCCSWDGIKCDGNTGRVIGLDLSSSFLYGSINSSSSLFRLVHLQKLNLAYNNFNYSQIPLAIGHLPNLSYLNLSDSLFSGQIPLEISALSKLASLDLSYNFDLLYRSLLQVEEPTLNNLLQNLTSLEVLWLNGVNISSAVPKRLANSSSLISLHLDYCGLQGGFPASIFHFQNLRSLCLRYNPFLTGHLPEFNKSSPLELIGLYQTGFSGKLPNSIGNLNFLSDLDIAYSYISGSIPSSLSNLTQLEILELSSSNVRCTTWHWLGKQSKLTYLALEGIDLNGHIPPSLQNLTQIASLKLQYNRLTDHIPYWIGNLPQLTFVALAYNNLQGPIPQSFSNLVNLQGLFLYGNNFTGTLDFDKFLSLKNLTQVQLSGISLSLLTNNSSANATSPKLKYLVLRNCNLEIFPQFLRHRDELEILDLSENKICGSIPKWFWTISKQTLSDISLPYNFLTGQLPTVLPWTSLRMLILNQNNLEGPLPIPPPSTIFYNVDNNTLTGEISPLFCSLSSLQILKLSNNNLSGRLPQCLGNFSTSLSVLDLRNNKFSGPLPPACSDGSNLRMIDISKNQMQGLVPRSLVNCRMLEFLNLGDNQVIDIFPSWLGTLPELRVLILRSNRFHGAIEGPENKVDFPKLHVIDLSYNEFTGKLPSKYFESWKAMKILNVSSLTYMLETERYTISKSGFFLSAYYPYSMTITNKAIQTIYEAIPEVLVVIDLSSNKFEGAIPESMGNMRALRWLNLSNNILNGQIPSSLWNLTVIEALDLSLNKLSGEIPQQLAELSFMAFFNVSHNHLMGPIPHGFQFDTFDNTSFEGNSELCGRPLSKKCASQETAPQSLPPSTEDEGEDPKFPSGYDWIFILAGCGSGLVVGFIIGNTLTTRKQEWFVETFGRKPVKTHRKRIRTNRT